MSSCPNPNSGTPQSDPPISISARLLNAGQDVNPTKLHHFLMRHDITQEELNIASNYLQAAEAVRNTPSYRAMLHDLRQDKHCVQCHKEYTDETNTWESCQVPHVFVEGDIVRQDVIKEGGEDHWHVHAGHPNCIVSTGEPYTLYHSACCGESVRLRVFMDGQEECEAYEPCFEGQHTNSIQKVTYNGVNSQPCQMMNGECQVKAKTYDPGEIAWVN